MGKDVLTQKLKMTLGEAIGGVKKWLTEMGLQAGSMRMSNRKGRMLRKKEREMMREMMILRTLSLHR